MTDNAYLIPLYEELISHLRYTNTTHTGPHARQSLEVILPDSITGTRYCTLSERIDLIPVESRLWREYNVAIFIR